MILLIEKLLILVPQVTLAPKNRWLRRRTGILLPVLPLVANRRRIYGDIIAGILGVVGEARAVVAIAVAGALPGESYLIVIPTFLFAVLLIEISTLTY